MNRDLKKGFDIGELAKVIENGEHFKNVERKVEFIYSGKELPVIQKQCHILLLINLLKQIWKNY